MKLSFLDWAPDLEPVQNKGLVVATNTIHDADGYKPIQKASAGAFSTKGALSTVSSVMAKQVGTGDQYFYAWVNGTDLHVGIDGVTATSATTSPSFATIPSIGTSITALDVCELADVIFFTVEAVGGTVTPDTRITLRATGYLTYTTS